MSNVKGSKISLKLAFVKEYYGDDALARLLKSMPPEDQLALRMILDAGWYPIDLYHRTVIAICKVLARGDESVYTTIGHHSAQLSLDSVYKVFRAKNPITVLKNMVPLHSLMNDPGEMRVIPICENQCTVEVLKPESMVEICKVAKAFYYRSVELAGGMDIKIKHPRCTGLGHALCQFDIAWRKTNVGPAVTQ